jgi:2-dehydro-3-deoxyphosphogluconate aldolase/(4S)-4-hydroxy-2-oxoglutarate aldolase
MPMTGILKVGPVIPVIAIDDADKAVPLAHALIAGGISVLEITLRTPAAFDAVRQISAQVPDAVVGVGTITLPRQFEEAKAAGARFCVCPGLTRDLAKAAHGCGLPVLPGVMTPTEVIAAHGEGYRQLKLFPAEQAGGIAMLEALARSPTSSVWAGRG